MAELGNEKLGEDYLDDLLNSVSGPLPEENDDIDVPGETNTDNEADDDNILDFGQIDDDNNILDIDDSQMEDDILDLDIDKIESDGIMSDGDIEDNDINTGNEETEEDIFANDHEDIEQLLSMLDSEGIYEDYKNEDIDKIADELEDTPDLSSADEKPDKKDKKKKKKGGGLFGRKKKKNEEAGNLDISPDDNEQIIKSVEGSFYEGFDLSELEGLADLDDIEDRSADIDEKENEELKAERERKKKEKAEKKAEKKRLKKEKKAEKKAKRAEKRKEKEKKKRDKPRIPEERIKVSASTLILIVSLITAIVIVTVFGGRYFWYNSHINEASDLLIDKKYTEAYDALTGLKIKEKDKGLYRQLKILMYIEKEYNSYFNCIRIKMNNEALDSLLQGVEKYHLYKDEADEYGVSKQAEGIYSNILKELSVTFGINEEMAKELVSITDPQEYTRRVNDIVNSHIDSINQVKKEGKN